MNVLIIDDGLAFVKSASYQLNKLNIICSAVTTAHVALTHARIDPPKLIIANINVLCKDKQLEHLDRLRKEMSIPLIVIGQPNDADHVAISRNLNAEEFLTAPVSAPGLMKSIRRVFWRHTMHRLPNPPTLDLGEIVIDPDCFEVRVDGRRVVASVTEMELLYCLGVHNGQFVAREKLINSVWGIEATPNMALLVNSHMRGIREKIEPDRKNPRYIVSKRGCGYMLASANSEPANRESELAHH